MNVLFLPFREVVCIVSLSVSKNVIDYLLAWLGDRIRNKVEFDEDIL